jgi:hypothetical protein
MAEEQVFLRDGSMLVSSSRIEINGQTFATRNVGSVKVDSQGPSVLAILIAIIGAGACAGGSYVFGLCALAVGVIWAYTTMTKRKLKIVAGGGEVLALESTNGALVERLRSAIAEAIAVR